jgi:F-type H+-transporting ATPase subunit b
MDIQLPQILFQIINFGVVTGALTVLMFKPIRKMLAERSARIEEAQKAAETTLAEKKNIDEMKRKVIRDAEKQATSVVEEATRDAANRKKELRAQAQKEVQAELSKQMDNWQEEKAAEVARMRQEFADAVLEAAEKVTGMSLDKKAQSKLIDTELENLLQRI